MNAGYLLSLLGTTLLVGYEGPLPNRAEVHADQYDTSAANDVSLLTGNAVLPLSRIAGNVYLDISGDGTFSTYNDGYHIVQEPGIASVQLTLHGTDRKGRTVTMQYLTGPDGRFEFNNLEAGDYWVVETQPALFNNGTLSPGGTQGTIDLTDASRNTFYFQLGSGEDADHFNFGELLPVNISRHRYWAR